MNALLLLALASCGDKTPPEHAVDATVTDPRFVRPGPLERKDFTLPEVQSAELSNGARVMLVENHELPTVDVRIIFPAGGWSDPVGMEGLGSATFDMLNEGAGGMSAVELSAAGRRIASGVGTGASLDMASVSVDALTKHLEPALDLWATVLTEPNFPAAEWERLRKQRIQDVVASKSDPNSIAGRVFDRVAYGEAYDGRSASEESLKAISTDDMRLWYDQHVRPSDAVILVGGDITLEVVVPMLEARLGDWSVDGSEEFPVVGGLQPDLTTIHLVDKPGAAQSVIIAGRFTPSRDSEDYYPLVVGNTVFGGMFMSRLNMNLREDKGYTYGARSYLATDMAGTLWRTSTSVKSDTTAASLEEIFGELASVGGERTLTSDEVDYFKSSLLSNYPASFETTGYLLGQQAEVWRYGLPSDWLSSYVGDVQAVTAEQAQQAFYDHVASQPLWVVVVGDLASIRGPIEALGHPIVVMDVDGLVAEPVVTPVAP